MPVFRPLAAILALGFLLVAAAPAAAKSPHRACLSKAQQRAAVASHRAIRLSEAIRSARRHVRHSEALRARLCHHGGRLVYVLTLLARNGRVTRVTVDAANGRVIGWR